MAAHSLLLGSAAWDEAGVQKAGQQVIVREGSTIRDREEMGRKKGHIYN